MQQQLLQRSDGRHQLFMQTGVAFGVHWPSCEQEGNPSASMLPERSMSLAYQPRDKAVNAANRAQAKKRSMFRREVPEKPAHGTTFTRSVSVDGLNLYRYGGHPGRIQLEDEHPEAHDATEFMPLASGPLLGSWSNMYTDQTRSRDMRKGSLLTREKNGSGLRENSWESWDSSTSGDGEMKRPWVPRDRSVRIRDWSRVPGDTSITYGVRLYVSNVNQDLSHEENCERLLRQILERIASEELDVPHLKMRHVIKVEAFLRAVELSVPSKTWHQSMRGALSLSSPVANRKTPGHTPQMSEEELLFRMTLFVAMMGAERKGSAEADVSVDSMRVDAVVRGYATNATEFLPLQRPARKLLPPLLMCMACELLHVRLLGPEVRGVCRQIVSDYESRAKVWMSPQQNAERYLGPLVAEFVKWIRCNREVIYQGSATEGLLRSIDEGVRHRLKNQVYRSPEHFLMVMKSLEGQLTDTPLPSYDPSGGDDDHPFDVAQTLKDVKRERFYVNGVSTAASECWIKIRSSLLRGAKGDSWDANDSSTHMSAVELEGSGEENVLGDQSGRCEGSRENIERDEISRTNSGTATSLAESGRGASPACGDAAAGEVRNKRRSSFDVYIDHCAWRVLHAASRTASSGDSFFVVQDLFGGEGVLVKSATTATEPIKIETKGFAARVTTVDKYDIYHASDLDIHSSTCEFAPQPLITITTTMKEVIEFPFFGGMSLEGQGQGRGQSDESEESFNETAGMQLRHARVGRFITISASLPVLDGNHTGTSSRRDRRFGAGVVDELVGTSSETLLGAISTGCAPSLRRSSSAPAAGVSVSCFVGCPSAFIPPPPEPLPFASGWRRRRDSSGTYSDDAEVEGCRTMSMVGLANDDMLVGGGYR